MASPSNPLPLPAWYTPGMPVPGVVDFELASGIQDKDIIARVRRCRDESKEARRSSLEREWLWHTELYHSRQDFAEKADWQAQVFLPLVFTKVEVFKSLVKSALLSQRMWFGLDADPKLEETGQIQFLEKVLDHLLYQAKFVPSYMHALEEGGVLGTGALAFYWHTWIERSPRVMSIPLYQDPQQMMQAQMMGMPTSRDILDTRPVIRSGLRCRVAPCWAQYPDPYADTYDNCKYHVEEMAVDEEELEEGVKVGLYDSIDDIGQPVGFDLEKEYRPVNVELSDLSSRGRKRHLLQIYHGSFYSDSGKVALRNWRAVVANHRALIAIGPNLSYGGMRPYLWTTPLRFRGRVWGRSMIGPAANVQEELNNLVNLMIDSQTFSVLPITLSDPNKMTDPVDFSSVEPGRNYKGQEGAITPIKIGSSANDAWPMIQKFENVMGMAMGIDEFVEGTPTQKGRPTATEVTSKTQAAQAQITNMAQDLEESDLVRAVRLAYDLALTNLSDLSDPKLSDLINEWNGPTALLDPVQRFKLLDAQFRVRAKGISISLKRNEMQQKIMQTLQLEQQLGIPPGPMLQTFYRLLTAMELDPAEIGFAQTPMEQQQIIMQMMMAQQARQGGPGAAGGARGSGNSTAAPEQPPGVQHAPGPNRPEDTMRQMQQQGPPLP